MQTALADRGGPQTRGVRVLVVDDDMDTCESMARLLMCDGHAAHVAIDGREAIRQIVAVNPEVVLLDVAMPGMDGVDVARVVRRMQLPAQPVIAAVSGYTTPHYKRLCAEAGFDHYLLKPIEPILLDRLLWLVAEGWVLRERSTMLWEKYRAVVYAFAVSQLEFAHLLVDTAEWLSEPARQRCLEKVCHQQEKFGRWLDEETHCAPDQKAMLKTSLAALRNRTSKMR